jgi:hypothetical protein
VVGKRLSRLSPECNRLLAIAAVIGRDFNIETLRTVAPSSPSPWQGEGARRAGEGDAREEALLSSLEEAVRIGVLEERSRTGQVSYRFAHAFFRQTLYEEMIAPRRLRLHQEVARALESQYGLSTELKTGARREEHAAELAEHFAQSTDHADLAKAVEYGELAAQRAMSVYAYAEAASHLERCLAVQVVLDPEDKAKKCHLFLAFGCALMPAGQAEQVLSEIAPSAYALAEDVKNPELLKNASVLAVEAIVSIWGSGAAPTPEASLWQHRADVHTPPNAPERAFVDIRLMNTEVGELRSLPGDRWRQAIEISSRARAAGNREALFQAATVLLIVPPVEDLSEAGRIATEMAAEATTGVSSSTLSRLLYVLCGQFLVQGDRGAAETVFRRLQQLDERVGSSLTKRHVSSAACYLTILDGRLEEALSMTVEGTDDLPATRLLYAGQRILLEVWLGRADNLRTAVGEWIALDQPNRLFVAATAPLAVAGASEEVRHRLEVLGVDRVERSLESSPLSALAGALKIAILLKDPGLARRVIAKLEPAIDAPFSGFALIIPYSAGRIVGAGKTFLGDYEGARISYEIGIESCAKIGFRPEIALTRLGLAELLLQHYPDERVAAIEHLDFAIAEFREMKMQPSLERALRHRGLLKA